MLSMQLEQHLCLRLRCLLAQKDQTQVLSLPLRPLGVCQSQAPRTTLLLNVLTQVVWVVDPFLQCIRNIDLVPLHIEWCACGGLVRSQTIQLHDLVVALVPPLHVNQCRHTILCTVVSMRYDGAQGAGSLVVVIAPGT